LRACCATQAPSGWAVTPARRTCRLSSSMKKAHTVAAARRSPTEEIAGDDAGSLAAEKLRAPQACSPWRRLDAVPAQHGPDHARRDNETESGQLALDPSIPPVWVLGRQAQDQLAQLVGAGNSISPANLAGSSRRVSRAREDGGASKRARLPKHRVHVQAGVGDASDPRARGTNTTAARTQVDKGPRSLGADSPICRRIQFSAPTR